MELRKFHYRIFCVSMKSLLSAMGDFFFQIYILPLKSHSITSQLLPHCPCSRGLFPAIDSIHMNFKCLMLQLRSSVRPYTLTGLIIALFHYIYYLHKWEWFVLICFSAFSENSQEANLALSVNTSHFSSPQIKRWFPCPFCKPNFSWRPTWLTYCFYSPA